MFDNKIPTHFKRFGKFQNNFNKKCHLQDFNVMSIKTMPNET